MKVLPNGAYSRLHGGKLIRSYKYIYSKLAPKTDSVIDIGCCSGLYVSWMRKRGYDAYGVDGIPEIDKLTDGLVDYYDLSKPPTDETLQLARDWGFCMEVGEHIPAEFEDNLFANLDVLAKSHLVISWSNRVDLGYGHVNCHHPVYVGNRLASLGWKFDEKKTTNLVGIVHPRYNILVFFR